MDFLSNPKKKVIRTALYGDQELSLFELELLHTPVVQRLYDLKQLGFADRVFPDAVHSRFNHVLGAAELADKMARRLQDWLKLQESTARFSYWTEPGPAQGTTTDLSPRDLATHVESRVPVVRLMALLHDLTHAAYGHTLEDEVCVVAEKHDEPPRQVRFFDALFAQLVMLWCDQLGIRRLLLDEFGALVELSVDHEALDAAVEELAERLDAEQRTALANHLWVLESACSLLLNLERAHKSSSDPTINLPLAVSRALATLAPARAKDLVILHRDLFLLDIVGNTLCADLLDYARRDSHNAGLRVGFDDRVLRYLSVATVTDGLSPTGRPSIRLAIQFFTDKLRHDVLSEMSGILKARYLISERILFHPTKCAAGAMLGTSIQLLRVKVLSPQLQVLGDREFTSLLAAGASALDAALSVGFREDSDDPVAETRKALEGTLTAAHPFRMQMLEAAAELAGGALAPAEAAARVRGGRRLLALLGARRFPKLVFRLRGGVGGVDDESIAERFCDASKRYELERSIEARCNLPPGTVLVHCPQKKTTMKLANVLVRGPDPSKVVQLRALSSVFPSNALEPYQGEIRAVEEMYRSIWQFHAYLDVGYLDRAALVAFAFRKELGARNDPLLERETSPPVGSGNRYEVLVRLEDEFAYSAMPKVVAVLDGQRDARARHGDVKDMETLVREAIAEVNRPPPEQLELAPAKASKRKST